MINHHKLHLAGAGLLLSLFCAGATPPQSASANIPETVLHLFSGEPTDGALPRSELTLGPDGAFYGTTAQGGTQNKGTVFELTASGVLNLLHSFGDGSVANDGNDPQAGVVVGSDGAIYGTTLTGGAYNFGTVYKLTPDGEETILHSFKGESDGQSCRAALAFGKDGRLYGVTEGGDSSNDTYRGSIFSLNDDGSDYMVQYRFAAATHDSPIPIPNGTLIPGVGSDRKLYGTTEEGTNDSRYFLSAGTVYSITPGATSGSGVLKTLHTFGDGTVANDGSFPVDGSLQFDAIGNLYGVTAQGGAHDSGTIFKLAPDLSETVLHSFNYNTDGDSPVGGLLFGSDGNLYGTNVDGGAYGYGSVYAISTGGDFHALYQFTSNPAPDGESPFARPVEDADGNLFGTTQYGGSAQGDEEGFGTVYELATGLPNLVSVASLVVTPSTLTGNSERVTGTATLSAPAPSGGAKIALRVSDPLAAAVPATLVIPADAISGSFTVATYPTVLPTMVTVSAAYNATVATAAVTVTPMPPVPTLESVVLSPAVVNGGTQTTANRVYLAGDATADTPVTLTSSNPSLASVRSSIFVHKGFSSYVFPIAIKKVVASQTVTITATANGVSQNATLTINPAPVTLASMSLSPSHVKGGTVTIGNKIDLTFDAPSDSVVSLYSTNKTIAEVPATILIKQGHRSHFFTITTKPLSYPVTVTLIAQANGGYEEATLTVQPVN